MWMNEIGFIDRGGTQAFRQVIWQFFLFFKDLRSPLFDEAIEVDR